MRCALLTDVRPQNNAVGNPMLHLGYLAFVVAQHFDRLVEQTGSVLILAPLKLAAKKKHAQVSKSPKVKTERESSPAPKAASASSAVETRAAARDHILDTAMINTPITMNEFVSALDLSDEKKVQPSSTAYILSDETMDVKSFGATDYRHPGYAAVPHNRVVVASCTILAYPGDMIPKSLWTTSAAAKGYTMEKVSEGQRTHTLVDDARTEHAINSTLSSVLPCDRCHFAALCLPCP